MGTHGHKLKAHSPSGAFLFSCSIFFPLNVVILETLSHVDTFQLVRGEFLMPFCCPYHYD